MVTREESQRRFIEKYEQCLNKVQPFLEIYNAIIFAKNDLARVYASYEYLTSSISEEKSSKNIPNFRTIYEVFFF